uniref:Uncharacterized protein n=1 Tax=Knipowitschia caucasica TaxID=637954 RepID=A0AAV2K8T1_KNICA
MQRGHKQHISLNGENAVSTKCPTSISWRIPLPAPLALTRITLIPLIALITLIHHVSPALLCLELGARSRLQQCAPRSAPALTQEVDTAGGGGQGQVESLCLATQTMGLLSL